MWNRKELKMRGKEAWRRNKFNCIIAGLLITILTASGSAGGASQAAQGDKTDTGYSIITINGIQTQPTPAEIIGVIVGVAIGLLVTFALLYFLFNPLVFGARKFFLDNTEKNADLGRDNLTFVFNSPYKKNLRGALFGTDIYILLWTLLLIIPGVVKAYSWRLVSYLLAENPSMTGPQARAESARIMYGNRWKTFILDLSFIGWMLLGICTLGILNLIFTHPYLYATDAELYRELTGKKPVSYIETERPEETVTFEVTE